MEPTLLAQMWASQPQNCACERAVHISHLADQTYSYPEQDPGLWLDLLQNLPHLWSAGAGEGTWPTNPKLRNLQNTEWQWDVQEVLVGLSTEHVVETRDLEPGQWLSVVNTWE